jgi:hypothetical protein
MNLSLASVRALTAEVGSQRATESREQREQEESAQVRRLWSLVSLLALYAAALLLVLLVSDGPDIGCILMGIAGHVLYASGKTAHAWREAAWLDCARSRVAVLQQRRRLQSVREVGRERDEIFSAARA